MFPENYIIQNTLSKTEGSRIEIDLDDVVVFTSKIVNSEKLDRSGVCVKALRLWILAAGDRAIDWFWDLMVDSVRMPQLVLEGKVFGKESANTKFVDTCLKDDDGKWVELHINDPEGVPIRLYVGPDVGPQQERLEILTGVLGRVVGEVLGTDAFARKREGEVFVNFVPVAAVEVPDSRTVELSFNMDGCEEVSLDVEKVKALFQERTKRKAPKWTKCS